jgi:HAD superfamily hydrolase (TIGR01509 family)
VTKSFHTGAGDGSGVTGPPLDGIAAVLFDLDETLIGSRVAWLGRVLALLHGHGHDQDDQRVVAAYSTPRPLLFPVVVSRGTRRVVAWCDGRLRRGVTLTSEVQSVLHALDQAALPYGIVTNGQARKRHTLRLLGLEDRAAAIVISGDLGRHKPDATVFARAAAELGVRPGTVLFVGDKLQQDIRGARSAGMKTAWLRRGRTRRSDRRAAPDLVLASIGDLPATLGLRPD